MFAAASAVPTDTTTDDVTELPGEGRRPPDPRARERDSREGEEERTEQTEGFSEHLYNVVAWSWSVCHADKKEDGQTAGVGFVTLQTILFCSIYRRPFITRMEE